MDKKQAGGATVKVSAVDQDRAGAAAAVRRRQPAGPDRQLAAPTRSAGTRSCDQLETLATCWTRTTSRAPRSRDTLYARRQGAGHASTASSWPSTTCMTVYGIWYSDSPVRGQRLDRAEDLGQDLRASAPRRRRRASTSSSGARRRRPTTRRSSSTPRSRRAATRCASRWRTSKANCWSNPTIQAVLTSFDEHHPGRLHEAGRRGHAVHRGAGAVEPTTRPRCSTPRARGSRTR